MESFLESKVYNFTFIRYWLVGNNVIYFRKEIVYS